MAGKQHESRPDQDSPRKGQISDESGKRDMNHQININYNTHESLQKSPENSLEITDEDTLKTGIHFYTLSIMNETNKVLLI